MQLLCVGLSHKSAPLSVRERLALDEEAQRTLVIELAVTGEAMVLSTCNRVEFYVAAPAIDEARRAVQAAILGMAGAEALSSAYEQVDDAALVHLFRVAASLDSMVLGEAQILGQVKEALDRAVAWGGARGELQRLCSAAFGSAKRVRTETAIGRAATSMASAAVALATKVFGGLEGKSVLVVGAGEMAELAAKHLVSAGASHIVVANRTLTRGEELARSVGGEAKSLDEVAKLLVWADLVVCSTASAVPIFTKELVGGVLKARKHRPLFMVDLAVPRDIAPDVNELENVYSYDVDDIQKVVSENAAQRQSEVQKAEIIIAEEIARYVRSRSVRDSVPVLAQLRSRAQQIAQAEAEKTLSAIGGALSEKQRKSVEAMATAIVNKLLHQPTAKLRAVGEGGAQDHPLVGAAAELFGLASEQRDGEEPDTKDEGAKPDEPAAGLKP